jgi:hypothetical protein
MYRQGDVLLVPCKVVPKEAKAVVPENGRLILARGEATGHNHSVSCEKSDLLELDGKVWLVAGEDVGLEHQEHGTVEIASGSYWVVRQREYTPQEIRRVSD